MKLAARLGMTRARMRREMPSAEFTDWIAFMEIEHDDKAEALEKGVQAVTLIDSLQG